MLSDCMSVGVKQVAQRCGVADLPADGILARERKSVWRNGNDAGEIHVRQLCPVERDHGGGDLREAADLHSLRSPEVDSRTCPVVASNTTYQAGRLRNGAQAQQQ